MDAYTLNYRWDKIRDQLVDTWPTLTEDELDNVDGNLDKLYGLMWEKCGQSRTDLDRYLDCLPQLTPHRKLAHHGT